MSTARSFFLRNSEVEWIEAAANYLRIHAGQRVFLVRHKISDFEKTLAPEKFVRIHLSLIVDLDAISEIQSCGGGEFMVLLRSARTPMGADLSGSFRRPGEEFALGVWKTWTHVTLSTLY